MNFVKQVSFFKALVFTSILFCYSFTVKAQWTQIGADIDGEAANDFSGLTASMPDTNTVAVGAYQNDGNGTNSGHVRIYRRSGTSWIQKGLDIDGEVAVDRSGFSVSMPDSNTIAIGAPFNDGSGADAGHVRVYDWSGVAWIQRGLDIDGEAAGDRSGSSISMPDINTIAIGAFLNNGNGTESGHVRIYRWDGLNWVQKGLDIDGEAANDQSGFSVSMPDSNTIAIGAHRNDGNGIDAGHTRIYEWSGTNWVQKGNDIDGEAADDLSGASVSMPDSNTLAIGAYHNDNNGLDAGHTRIYDWSGTAWLQRGLDIDGESAGDESATSVDMPNPNIVAVGAPNNDGIGTDAGHTRVFEWNGTSWQQLSTEINGELTDDRSGFSVSMADSNTIAIGAFLNDGNGSNSGHVRVFNLLPCTMNVVININNNVSCFGANDGSLTAIPSSGSAPYNYIWSNSATTATAAPLPAGAYTVTVTDFNGCVDSASSFITTPIGLSINPTSTDASCNGASDGTATSGAAGGNPPYTYLWSNAATTASINGLNAGTYTVTITDNGGCTISGNVTVNQPATLVANTLVNSNASCNGSADGSITASATGGSLPYAYLWSNSATSATINGLAVNTYTVTVTDNNACTSTANTTINQPTILNGSIALNNNTSCFGGNDGSLTAAASGGAAPYTYAWNNLINTATNTNLIAGAYTVTISDANACTSVASAAVLEPSQLAVNITIDSLPKGFGTADGGITANASGGTPGYNYSWSSTPSTLVSLNNLAAGTYTVTVTDNNGCTSSSFIVLNQPAPLSCLTNAVNTSCPSGMDGSATVIPSGGIAPYTYLWSNSDISQTTNNLIAGVYTVTLSDNNGITTTCNATIGSPTPLSINSSAIDVSCFGFSDGAINTAVSGGTSPYTYNWNNSAITANINNLITGAYTVTVTDANGCSATESSTINVGDITRPTAITQNITAYLDFNGQLTISPNDIDNGSFDNCAIASISLDSSNFDCTEIGLNLVELLVIDNNGNRDSAAANVTIQDTIRPIALASNSTIYLNSNGNAVINPSSIDNGSLDNCSISTFSLSQTNFNCSNIGSNSAVFSVIDASGNRDSINISLNILDTIKPTINTSDITVYLDQNREVNITSSDIDNGSFDNCGISNLSLSKSNFNCNDLAAPVNINLIVIDLNGNIDSNSATVTVLDTFTISIDTTIASSCDNYTWPQNNQVYNTTGFYRDTFLNIIGCDSAYFLLDLRINNSTFSIDSITACDSLVWIDGITYTSNNNTATDTLTNLLGCDSIITLNLTIVNSNGSSQTTTACDTYTWPENNQTYSTSGIFTEILSNVDGCDSTISLDLTILNLDATIFNVDDSLFAFQDGNSYQWIDCRVDTIIPGATSQGFKPDTTGFYAVIVDNGSCSDTSSCQFYDFVSLEEIADENSFRLYPNPANDNFFLETNTLFGDDILQVYDMRGAIILERNIYGLKERIDVEEWDAGIYFIMFQNKVKKVVITE